MNRPLMSSTALVALLFIVQTTLVSSLPSKVVKCKGVKLTRLGCYKDSQTDRPIPKLVLTARDRKSPVYSGNLISWKDWDGFMVSFICNCSRVSLSKGYSVIGLQYFGECWSGPDSLTARYAKDGPSPHCVSWKYSKCRGGLDCLGEDHANFVYRVNKDVAAPPTPSTPSPTPSGCQNPSLPCNPPCQPMVPQALPMPYQPAYPQIQNRYPQTQCSNGCPARCAPRCNPACCWSFRVPLLPPGNFAPVATFGFPQVPPRPFSQAVLRRPLAPLPQCNGCPARCAPRCTIGCCQWFGRIYKKSRIDKLITTVIV